MSNRRLKANHRNCKKSTGPRTDRGKSRSSTNALKHGLRSKRAVLPGESSDLFNVFCKSVISLLEPSDLIQASFAEMVASGLWRLRRSALIEDQMFAYAEKQIMSASGADQATVLGQAWIQYDMHFARLRRYQTSEERSIRAILFEFGRHRGYQQLSRWTRNTWSSDRLVECMEMLRNEEHSRSPVDIAETLDVRLTHAHNPKAPPVSYNYSTSYPQSSSSQSPAKEQTLADAKVSFKQLSDSLRAMDKYARKAGYNPSRRHKKTVPSAPVPAPDSATAPVAPDSAVSPTADATAPVTPDATSPAAPSSCASPGCSLNESPGCEASVAHVLRHVGERSEQEAATTTSSPAPQTPSLSDKLPFPSATESALISTPADAPTKPADSAPVSAPSQPQSHSCNTLSPQELAAKKEAEYLDWLRLANARRERLEMEKGRF